MRLPLFVIAILLGVVSSGTPVVATQQRQSAALIPVSEAPCAGPPACSSRDAVIFVHGIYGNESTFTNATTAFNWPRSLPSHIVGRTVDVFLLSYQTELLSWAKKSTATFDEIASTMLAALGPLRRKEYRSIGFIAHSLGGNFVSTYLHMVKTRFGHPQRSQHAYVIALATPVLGAQVADIAFALKGRLGMVDPLLSSLQKDSLYLTMLNTFRNLENPKEALYGCRAVSLHAAYETQRLAGLLVVQKNSAAESISRVATSVVGFSRNHSTIVKPRDAQDEVYTWVQSRIEQEFSRLDIWDKARKDEDASHKLCADIPFKPEA